MEEQVTITVDGQTIRAPKGALLWEVCQEHGIDIPIFCYHTKLGPVGACRTCLVEQEGVSKGPITACSTQIADGMKIRTRSPMAQKAQRGIFEFLLANHPLDCPICDRGGECPLQDQTFDYGPGSSRYVEPKRHHVKPIVLGPTIALDRERCVLCWRCVRFCAEVAEDDSIVLLNRGDHTVVGTYQDQPYVSQFSGNVIELCPVGALTSRKQRFNFRPWELSNRPSVCPHCAMGCNINLSVRKNDEVIRFLSRDNPEVDDSWLCDRGRFGFEFINSPERLEAPLIRTGDVFRAVSWHEAFQYIADRLSGILDPEEGSGAGAVVGIASPRVTNEDLFVFKRFMNDVIGTDAIDHFPRSDLSLSPDGQAALEQLDGTVMGIAELQSASTIVLLGADPSRREPVLELAIRKAVNGGSAKLVVLVPDEMPLTAKADLAITCRAEELADLTAAMTAALRGDRVDTAAGIGAEQIESLARDYLTEGKIAVIYDDSAVASGATDALVRSAAQFVSELGKRADVGTIPLLSDCNSMGARDLKILPRGGWAGSVVDRLRGVGGPVRAAFVIGPNLARDLPGNEITERLAELDLLVVSELMLTDTAKLADVVLPAASFAEKNGTFTNTERRVQLVREAVPAPGIARADWQILVDLSQYFERPLDYAMPQDIWNDIRATVPAYSGISYDDIGAQGVRPEALQPVGGVRS